jgi:hypothetical protein
MKARAAVVGCVLLAACTNPPSTVKDVITLKGDEVLATSADLRIVNKVGVTGASGGRVRPTHIVCAEPSPDIAKAVSESFNTGGSFGVAGLPSGVSPKAAIALAVARAESVAQMTERLATIQLLRDGLYRACEAYANGAISDTAYAVLLSRYDDTMVTMLLGELAAGHFGGKLAALGTRSSGDASADLKSKVERLSEILEERSDVPGTGTGPTAGSSESKTEGKEDRKAEDELRAAVKSLAEATNVLAVEGAAFSQNDKIAATIATMQRKFIENINADALVVACISALDDSDARTALAKYCIDHDLLGKVIALQGDILKGKLARSDQLKSTQAATELLLEDIKAIFKLRAELNPDKN